jgi:beta-phosphoglucomutase-like phosphatase (HAD superfamily)
VRIILFDIDGTLTATSRIDNTCYARAFSKTFGREIPSTEWSCYEHVTDVGILRELLDREREAPLSASDIEQFEQNYRRELECAFVRKPAEFRAIPGAREVLRRLSSAADICVGLATGGMRRTALFKLSRAGIDGARMPGAFADDAISRAEIARTAIARSEIEPDDVVYVGDGVWDVRTAAELGMRFVGVSHESDPEGLRMSGATTLISDYSDTQAFFLALETASVPIATNPHPRSDGPGV